MGAARRQLLRESVATTVIAAGLMVGAANWFLLPAAKDRAQSQQQSRVIERSLQHALDLDAVRSRLEEIRDRIEFISNMNDRARDSAQLFDLLSRYGRETGVEMGKVSPGTAQTIETGVTSESLNVTLGGSYGEVVAYIERLSDCELFHRIASLRIVPQEASEASAVTAYIQIEFIRYDTDAVMMALAEEEKQDG